MSKILSRIVEYVTVQCATVLLEETSQKYFYLLKTCAALFLDHLFSFGLYNGKRGKRRALANVE